FLGVVHALRLTLEALRDALGALLGRPARVIAAVGPPGSLAVMNSPDAEPGFRRIDPAGSTWRNETAARVVLDVTRYRPGRHADRITCPVLYCIGDRDVV